MEAEVFDNVWDAISDSRAEAANMTARSELLSALIARVEGLGLTREAATRQLGLTRPRLNDLLRGKINEFSLDALVNFVSAAGLVLELKVKEVT